MTPKSSIDSDEKTPLKPFMTRDRSSGLSNLPRKKKKSGFREYFEAFVIAILIACFLRAFVVEAFKIPSKSMVPTLMVGDHIFVNKFIYGIRIPFTKKWIAHFATPKRGQVIVFIYPRNESLDFIKRVVGTPGDKISAHGEELSVNGEKVTTYALSAKEIEGNHRLLESEALAETLDKKSWPLPYFREWKDYNFFVEKLDGVYHLLQQAHDGRNETVDVTVPEDRLFVMGDNRDNSSDSREWGFVPMENVKGRALFIWLSPDVNQGLPFGKALVQFFTDMRWNRIGKWIE